MIKIKPNYYDAIRLNKIIFENYVANVDETGNVISYIDPFPKGTYNYIDVKQTTKEDLSEFYIDDIILKLLQDKKIPQEDKDFVQLLINSGTEII